MPRPTASVVAAARPLALLEDDSCFPTLSALQPAKSGKRRGPPRGSSARGKVTTRGTGSPSRPARPNSGSEAWAPSAAAGPQIGTPMPVSKPKKRRLVVTFDLGAGSVHEIPRYAEIYGMHPRAFHFDRDGNKIPSWGLTLRERIRGGSWNEMVDSMSEDDSSSDSDEEERPPAKPVGVTAIKGLLSPRCDTPLASLFQRASQAEEPATPEGGHHLAGGGCSPSMAQLDLDDLDECEVDCGSWTSTPAASDF